MGHEKLWECKLRKQKQHLLLQNILHRYLLLHNRSQFPFKTLSHKIPKMMAKKVKRFFKEKKKNFKDKYLIASLL